VRFKIQDKCGFIKLNELSTSCLKISNNLPAFVVKSKLDNITLIYAGKTIMPHNNLNFLLVDSEDFEKQR
jgi:hypothetical protein